MGVVEDLRKVKVPLADLPSLRDLCTSCVSVTAAGQNEVEAGLVAHSMLTAHAEGRD
jgi:hypothetical protein